MSSVPQLGSFFEPNSSEHLLLSIWWLLVISRGKLRCKGTKSYNLVGEEAYVNLEFQLVELEGISFQVDSLLCL